MIELKEITKKYDQNLALDKVSFEVRKGEVLGFLGPNGAGKTTTMKIITGFIEPDAGEAKVAGLDAVKDSLLARRKIGYLPEAVPLYDDMKVYEYLKFIAEIRDLEQDKVLARIKEVAEACGLRQVIGKSIDELSKGYKQRVGLAQAIMHDPDILVLDEPTTGLDPNQIAEIRELIKQIGQSKTVIFSTHILAEAQATCDRVVIINKGQVVEKGTPAELAARLDRGMVYYLKVKGPEDQVVDAARSLPGVADIQVRDRESGIGLVLETDISRNLQEELATLMMEKRWPVLEFRQTEATLEDVFRQLTAN